MANQLDPYNPQWWAFESLAVLRENMVALKLVNRDFEAQFAKGGDVVNTRKPQMFKGIRKAKSSSITVQDANADNVAVPLNQHVTVSFSINDIDDQYSLKDLTTEFLNPAGLALARFADRVVLGQAARFFGAGKYTGITSADTYFNIVDANTQMSKNLAPPDFRQLILAPTPYGKLLKSKDLFPVERSGDGMMLRNGFVGRLSDFNTHMAQNQMDVSITTVAGKIGSTTTTGIALKGTSVITLSADSSPAIAANQTIIVDGVPYIVISVATLAVTLDKPLKYDVASGATVWVLNRGTITNTYAAGYTEAIVFTTGSGIVEPKVGAVIKVGSVFYTVVDTHPSIANAYYLDRPLEVGVTAGDRVNIIIGAQFNFAFHRDALTAAIRPMRPVPTGTGANSYTAIFDGLTVRATIGYDMTTQNQQCTLDFLMGVQVLDADLGQVVFS